MALGIVGILGIACGGYNLRYLELHRLFLKETEDDLEKKSLNEFAQSLIFLQEHNYFER